MAKYVISYDKNVDLSTLQTALVSAGCTIEQVLDSLAVLIVTSDTTDFSSVEGVLAYELEIDISVNEHWHLNRICSSTLPMRGVYFSKNKGLGTTIYLVDSGIDATHPELVGADIQNLWSWDGDFTDTNGHGTSLASVMVGPRLGVSTEATVKSVKIPFGQPVPVSVLLNAFNAILSDHLLTPTIKVINCSWSIPKSLILDNKIIELQGQGLVVVAAAGNTISDANELSPVGLNTVLGVGASDAYDRVISWATGAGSNWGPDVDITAPGIEIEVASITNGATEIKSGTSTAAAIVSAAVCQYIVDNPSVTSSETIQDLVIANAKIDMLFRNESVYGTTPNRLLYLPEADIVVSPTREERIIEIQRGNVTTVPVSLMSPATSINIYNVAVGSRVRTAPEWVSLEGTTITISPPSTLEPGKYVLEVDVLKTDNVSVGHIQLAISVYISSPSELDEVEMYSFFVLDENELVTIIQSQCQGFCWGNTTCAGLGKNCFCVGSTLSCAQT